MRRAWIIGAAVLLLTASCQERRTEQGRGGDHTANERRVDERNMVGPTIGAPGTAEDRDAARAARSMAAARALSASAVDSAKLVQQRGASNDVKQFAARLGEARARDVEALDRAAEAKHLDLTAAADEPLVRALRGAAAEELDRLSRLSGAPLDAAYLGGQPLALALLEHVGEDTAGSTKDADLASALRRITAEAKEDRARALAALPVECGGASTAAAPAAGRDAGADASAGDAGHR